MEITGSPATSGYVDTLIPPMPPPLSIRMRIVAEKLLELATDLEIEAQQPGKYQVSGLPLITFNKKRGRLSSSIEQPNASRRWSDEDQALLLNGLKLGMSNGDLAKRLGRTEVAIQRQRSEWVRTGKLCIGVRK